MRVFLLLIFLISNLSYSSGQIITTIAGGGSGGLGDGGPATNAQLKRPKGIAIDTSGNIYIADCDNRRIRKISKAGIISTVGGNGLDGESGDGGLATSATLNVPFDVAVDKYGNIYIADSSGSTRKITIDRLIMSVARIGYFGIAVDILNNVYGSDWGSINKLTTAGKVTIAGDGTFGGFSGDGGAATSAKLNRPIGVTVDKVGNIYIADVGNGRIRKVSTEGIITTVAGGGSGGLGDGGPATAAHLSRPSDVAVDNIGNIFIADTYNHRIRKVDTNGIITTIIGNGIAGFSGDGGPASLAQLNEPNGIAVDNIGNIYIAEVGNNRIRKVTAPTANLNTCTARILPGDTIVAKGARVTLSADSIMQLKGEVNYLNKNNSPAIDVPVNEWSYVVVTKGAGNVGNIYKNGQLAFSGSFENVSYFWNRLDLGAVNYIGYNKFFRGLIDEVRVSNSVRTAQEILDSYNATAPLNVDNNTIGLWHFDESTGTSISSVTGPSGTTNNGVFTTGKFGNAIYYNGVNSYSTMNLTIPTTNMTFEFWIKPDTLKSSFPISLYGMYTCGMELNISKKPYKYLWATGDTTETINVSPNQTTKYWLRQSDFMSTCTDTITVTVQSTLPLNLTTIKVQNVNKGAIVRWTSEQEINVGRFIIERSSEGRSFENIGEVKAKGTNGINEYFFTDKAVMSNDVIYYRLKIVNNDGTFSYSSIVTFFNESSESQTIFINPNPINQSTFEVQIKTLSKGAYNIDLVSLAGQSISLGQINHSGGFLKQRVLLPIELSKGVYLLKVANNSKQFVQRVVVQ